MRLSFLNIFFIFLCISNLFAQVLLNHTQPRNRNIIGNYEIIPDYQVSEDLGDTRQVYPSICCAPSGNFVITWQDNRFSQDIYAQRYLSDGTALGTNFKVNDQSTKSLYDPSISCDDSGNFVVTWYDYGGGESDVYAQRFTNDGTPVDTNFKVNDDLGNERQLLPDIASDNNGNFIIVWADRRNGNYDIFAQRYSSNGMLLGNNFEVNDDNSNETQWKPSVSPIKNGNFMITWHDFRNGYYDIFAQRYTSNGTPVGSNFLVSDDYLGVNHYDPTISSDDSSNYVITWADDRSGIFEVYAQRYSSDGLSIGINFKVTIDSVNAEQSSPSVSCDNLGNFIISWQDNRNGINNEDVYAQRFSKVGTPIGNNFSITNTNVKDQEYPEVKLVDGLIINTWQDNRRINTSEYDIWANILDWSNPTRIIKKDQSKQSYSFYLSQNYPNPFNPTTTIIYTILEKEKVKIEVLNLFGQKIETLINNQISAGSHEIEFNAIDLPSGIYLYRIEVGGYQEVKKMILLK